ncbi:RNA polymerase sigma factor [Marinigracilibium pacificum]|uniref:Sigma-70 family RNA polymerase sigma factor n=1 Tax=Marinigracilibium pacificum TaxID=2729599 RepID=A0A848J5U9_9BACT|nr:sigma-70 family RNA polymerase sigma factor [Marinigracilibium pacificum]NMM48502.1 sigma-70 family RNA polymerase sigma factor [Marinigracilibium pacificum]
MPKLSKEKFVEQIESHQGIIYKVCKVYREKAEDQEDLFQDIVYQLWKSYSDFKGNSKLSTWIYRIALNTALASFRKKKVNIEYKESLTPDVRRMNDRIENSDREYLFDAIRQLNEGDRALVSLYLEGYSYKEIADITGITITYVGVRINRIKIKLKALLNFERHG